MTESTAPTPKKPKRQSRASQWAEAAGEAVDALQRLVDLQAEFEDWRDRFPENLQGSPTGEKLDAICALDLSSALDTAQEAEGTDVPLGFGRD